MRPDQIQKIEAIFQARAKELEPLVRELEKQDKTYKQMLIDRVESEAMLSLQYDRVDAPRVQIFKSRSMMLYRISRELTAEQHKKLQTIDDRERRRNEPHRK